MTKDFTVPSNPTSEKIVRESVSFSEMLEKLKASQGRGDVAGAPAPKPAPVALPAEPAGGGRLFRKIYPHGNDAYEIYGSSEEELNQKEARIRALYA